MTAQFERPVTVLVGLGIPRRLADVNAALSFLEELPTGSRDEAHEATVSVCRDVLSGTADIAMAYDLLCAYARRRDVFIEDAPFGLVQEAITQPLAA